MEKQTQKVGTHNGRFHADDVFGYAILKKLFTNLELTRTRNIEILNSLDIVFDVGGGKFDHHNVEKEYREGVPYAASGLLWREFGRELLMKQNLLEEDIESIFQHIDRYLMQGLDALDNGVEVNGDIPIPTVAHAVDYFNPSWDSNEDEDEAFMKAVVFAGTILDGAINHQLAIVRSKNIVRESFLSRTIPEIIVLEKGCNWEQTLMELDEKEEILFVVYPNKNEGYHIQVVRKDLSQYAARKDLPDDWAGKRDEELNAVIGINDSVFCHPARFVAGAKSFESIMKMAELSIMD